MSDDEYRPSSATCEISGDMVIRNIPAGTKADDEDENDMDEKLKECQALNEEASMPLVDLLAKYKKQSKL